MRLYKPLAESCRSRRRVEDSGFNQGLGLIVLDLGFYLLLLVTSSVPTAFVVLSLPRP